MTARERSLSDALQEALIWWLVEEKPGPRYRVPREIQGDLFNWTEVDGKAAAYRTIKAAVAKMTEPA